MSLFLLRSVLYQKHDDNNNEPPDKGNNTVPLVRLLMVSKSFRTAISPHSQAVLPLTSSLLLKQRARSILTAVSTMHFATLINILLDDDSARNLTARSLRQLVIEILRETKMRFIIRLELDCCFSSTAATSAREQPLLDEDFARIVLCQELPFLEELRLGRGLLQSPSRISPSCLCFVLKHHEVAAVRSEAARAVQELSTIKLEVIDAPHGGLSVNPGEPNTAWKGYCVHHAGGIGVLCDRIDNSVSEEERYIQSYIAALKALVECNRELKLQCLSAGRDLLRKMVDTLLNIALLRRESAIVVTAAAKCLTELVERTASTAVFVSVVDEGKCASFVDVLVELMDYYQQGVVAVAALLETLTSMCHHAATELKAQELSSVTLLDLVQRVFSVQQQQSRLALTAARLEACRFVGALVEITPRHEMTPKQRAQRGEILSRVLQVEIIGAIVNLLQREAASENVNWYSDQLTVVALRLLARFCIRSFSPTVSGSSTGQQQQQHRTATTGDEMILLMQDQLVFDVQVQRIFFTFLSAMVTLVKKKSSSGSEQQQQTEAVVSNKRHISMLLSGHSAVWATLSQIFQALCAIVEDATDAAIVDRIKQENDQRGGVIEDFITNISYNVRANVFSGPLALNLAKSLAIVD